MYNLGPEGGDWRQINQSKGILKCKYYNKNKKLFYLTFRLDILVNKKTKKN